VVKSPLAVECSVIKGDLQQAGAVDLRRPGHWTGALAGFADLLAGRAPAYQSLDSDNASSTLA